MFFLSLLGQRTRLQQYLQPNVANIFAVRGNPHNQFLRAQGLHFFFAQLRRGYFHH